MNNFIVTTLFIGSALVSGNHAFAQKGFEFGIRYSVGESSLLNKTDADAGAELDYANTTNYLSGGIAGVYNLNRHMALELDILYARQGQTYSGVNMRPSADGAYNNQVALQAALNNKTTTGTYQAKAELNCIKFPLLFKLATDNTKRLYYTLSAGPQVNMIKSVVYEVNKEDVDLVGLNIEPADAYRKVTLDAVLGLGAGFNLSRHFALSAQARFDYGLQDVEKKDVTFTYNGLTGGQYYSSNRAATHNVTAVLMIGLNYKL